MLVESMVFVSSEGVDFWVVNVRVLVDDACGDGDGYRSRDGIGQ